MKKLIAAAILASPIVASCAPPIESVSTRIDTISTVSLINAADDVVLEIDDRRASPVDGNATLQVSDGWHEVRIFNNGREVHSRRVFVQDGTERIIDFASLK